MGQVGGAEVSRGDCSPLVGVAEYRDEVAVIPSTLQISAWAGLGCQGEGEGRALSRVACRARSSRNQPKAVGLLVI